MAELIQGTPPHQPTYNVRLSSKKIEAIISLVLPNHSFASCQQLESGKSFNNRIYFIETQSRSTEADETESRDSFVLKLSGHYFGARKVQNEVGSLLLMEKYCPSVPVPRLIAWSEDGVVIKNRAGEVVDKPGKAQLEPTCLTEDVISDHSWVLMTCLPGRILTKADLKGQYGRSLVRELAQHFADWRSLVPEVPVIGNIRLREPDDNDANLGSSGPQNYDLGPSFTIGGLVLSHKYCPKPLSTSLSYYTFLMNDQLFDLKQVPQLRPLHDRIGSRVRRLIDQLPYMSFFQHSTQVNRSCKFTHLDFSPRNIIVSETASQPHIAGILDFEFAAFLPYEEEFINMQVRQPDDWSMEEYSLLLNELANLGHEVPHMAGQFNEPVCTKSSTGQCHCDTKSLEGLSTLVSVIENIRPWWIQEGSHSGEELEKEIEIAAVKVHSDAEKLQEFVMV